MTYQTTIEGIDPRPSDTAYGAYLLRLRQRYGWARVLRRAHTIRRAWEGRRQRIQTREDKEAA